MKIVLVCFGNCFEIIKFINWFLVSSLYSVGVESVFSIMYVVVIGSFIFSIKEVKVINISMVSRLLFV